MGEYVTSVLVTRQNSAKAGASLRAKARAYKVALRLCHEQRRGEEDHSKTETTRQVKKTSSYKYLINIRACIWRGHGDWWATVRTRAEWEQGS